MGVKLNNILCAFLAIVILSLGTTGHAANKVPPELFASEEARTFVRQRTAKWYFTSQADMGHFGHPSSAFFASFKDITFYDLAKPSKYYLAAATAYYKKLWSLNRNHIQLRDKYETALKDFQLFMQKKRRKKLIRKWHAYLDTLKKPYMDSRAEYKAIYQDYRTILNLLFNSFDESVSRLSIVNDELEARRNEFWKQERTANLETETYSRKRWLYYTESFIDSITWETKNHIASDIVAEEEVHPHKYVSERLKRTLALVQNQAMKVYPNWETSFISRISNAKTEGRIESVLQTDIMDVVNEEFFKTTKAYKYLLERLPEVRKADRAQGKVDRARSKAAREAEWAKVFERRAANAAFKVLDEKVNAEIARTDLISQSFPGDYAFRMFYEENLELLMHTEYTHDWASSIAWYALVKAANFSNCGKARSTLVFSKTINVTNRNGYGTKMGSYSYETPRDSVVVEDQFAKLIKKYYPVAVSNQRKKANGIKALIKGFGGCDSDKVSQMEKGMWKFLKAKSDKDKADLEAANKRGKPTPAEELIDALIN